MERQIRGMKWLTLLIARDQRSKLNEIEQQMQRLADIVDRFYELLGPRNWIFHDSLNLDRVEEILDEAGEPESAEQRLVELYRDKENSSFWVQRLRGIDGLRERFHQIERAREHYDADQFDSCVLHLLAVMDGFVNDFEPQARKGLAAREPDDMIAWDSVVGHHLGLTSALKAFRKTIKRRVDDEVFELHRHGIMHGSIVKFDNVVVATKAWNMLFAVADWAKATTKSKEPVAPEPSFREHIRQVGANRKMKEQMDAWKPTGFSRGDAEFEDHEIYQLTIVFLTAWRDSNFGALAGLASRLFTANKKSGQLAGDMRQAFDHSSLTDFEVTELENSAPALWLVRGRAVVNCDPGSFECRWLIEDEDGNPGYGSPSANWRLVFCDPSVWRRDE